TWSDELTAESVGLPSGPTVHVLAHLGLVVADVDADQSRALAAHARERYAAVLAVEPELVLRAIPAPAAPIAMQPTETGALTGGAGAVGAPTVGPAGTGMHVCVLDTGIATAHPDLTSRVARARSFVPDTGASVEDGNGHGTHCAGVACGPRASAVGA